MRDYCTVHLTNILSDKCQSILIYIQSGNKLSLRIVGAWSVSGMAWQCECTVIGHPLGYLARREHELPSAIKLA